MSLAPVRPPRSLYQRVVIAFGLSSFALSSLFAFTLWGAQHMAEDRMLERTLELELESYLERLIENPEELPPKTHWLTGTLNPQELPAPLRKTADGPDGIREITPSVVFQLFGPASGFKGDELTMLVRSLPSGERIYLYVDASQVEALDESMWFITAVLMVAVLAITSLGLLLGRITARRVIAPVIELADRVVERSGDEPSRPDEPLSRGFADDEVGFLARALEASQARSQAFLERERRFTRDASHELRSPVTIVRGAVELLESRPEAREPGVARPLQRIRRAAEDMSRLIEAFLWLAREEALSSGQVAVRLADEVEPAIERYRHLIEGKEIELDVDINTDATVLGPQAVLGIVLGNLIANAFFYTQRGRITLRGTTDAFTLDDSGPGIAPERLEAVQEPHQRGHDSTGFGLGLAICRDLCSRFGWRLELRPTELSETGTRATVWFRPGDSR